MLAGVSNSAVEILQVGASALALGSAAVVLRAFANSLAARLVVEKGNVHDELEAKLPPAPDPTVTVAQGDRGSEAQSVQIGEVTVGEGGTLFIAQTPLSNERQFGLLKDYYSETLAQARLSFRLAAVAAGVGFLLIAGALVISLFLKTDSGLLQDSRTSLPIVGAVVAEAVAALFITQWRSAQSTMVEFFNGLSKDRRLDEALALSHQITDLRIRSATQSTLAMALLDLQPGRVEHLVDGLRALAGADRERVLADTDRHNAGRP